MENWILCTDKLPEFKDISQNSCSYFLVTQKYESTAQRRYFNSKEQKWYKDSKCETEVEVIAWQLLPKILDK